MTYTQQQVKQILFKMERQYSAEHWRRIPWLFNDFQRLAAIHIPLPKPPWWKRVFARAT